MACRVSSSGSAGGSCQSFLGAVGEVAGAGGRDDLPAGGLVEVVLDDGFELGHHGQLALDHEAAAVTVDGEVDEAHDAEHALAADDTLAAAMV